RRNGCIWHLPTRESAAKHAPARRTSSDSEIRPDCKSPHADFPGATGPPHVASARYEGLSIRLASWGRSAAYPAHGERSLQSASSPRTHSASPRRPPPPPELQPARRKGGHV